jgi:hypothetical protein
VINFQNSARSYGKQGFSHTQAPKKGINTIFNHFCNSLARANRTNYLYILAASTIIVAVGAAAFIVRRKKKPPEEAKARAFYVM